MITKPSTLEKANTSNVLQTTKAEHVLSSFGIKLLRNLFWLPVVTVAAILVLEGIFCFAHIGEEQIWKPDPSFGFVGYANKRFTFRSEGYSEGIYNSAGFNDREFSLVKPPGVVRIAVLGDSKTEALQVSRQSNFSKVLERQLNLLGNNHFEVMNCGVSAFGTGQEYLFYLDHVAAYKPDILVVVYNPADNEENTKPDYLKASEIFPRPYFSVSGDGKLSVDWSVVDGRLNDFPARFYKKLEMLSIDSRILPVLEKTETAFEQSKLISHLGLGHLFETVFSPLRTKLLPLLPSYESRPKLLSEFNSTYGQVAVKCPVTFDLPNNQCVIQRIYSGTDTIFHVTANILCRLNQDCNDHHCKLVVACLPTLNNDIRYFRELKDMSKLAKAEGFLFVDIHKAFPSIAPMQSSDLLFPSWHFTAKGHKLVADTLYHELVDSHLVQ